MVIGNFNNMLFVYNESDDTVSCVREQDMMSHISSWGTGISVHNSIDVAFRTKYLVMNPNIAQLDVSYIDYCRPSNNTIPDDIYVKSIEFLILNESDFLKYDKSDLLYKAYNLFGINGYLALLYFRFNKQHDYKMLYKPKCCIQLNLSIVSTLPVSVLPVPFMYLSFMTRLIYESSKSGVDFEKYLPYELQGVNFGGNYRTIGERRFQKLNGVV